MKTLAFVLALALLAGCARTPEEKAVRAARIAQERKEWKEANFQYELEEYAHRLGKAVAELSDAQRAEARHIFERDHPQ